jgi:hypothetical protein
LSAIVNQAQQSIPIEIRSDEIARKKTLGGALELCAELRGYAFDKNLQSALDLDKAQLSRWSTGGEGIIWPKFVALMDHCENDAPLMWMNHQRGYDISSMRKRQTETERRLEQVEAELRQMRHDYEMKIAGIREARAAA